jgi:hypothetical protein
MEPAPPRRDRPALSHARRRCRCAPGTRQAPAAACPGGRRWRNTRHPAARDCRGARHRDRSPVTAFAMSRHSRAAQAPASRRAPIDSALPPDGNRRTSIRAPCPQPPFATAPKPRERSPRPGHGQRRPSTASGADTQPRGRRMAKASLPRSAHWARAVQRPRVAAPVGPADAAAGRGTRSGGGAPRPASTQRRPCPATPTAWQRPIPPRRWARGGLRLRYVRGQRRHAGAMTIRARKPRGRSATLRWPRRGPRNPRRPGERCRAAPGAVPGRSCSRTRLPGIRRFHKVPGLESALSFPLGRTETMNRKEHACETG